MFIHFQNLHGKGASTIDSQWELVMLMIVLPSSWLLSKARQGKTEKYETAFGSLCRLRHTRLQAARDLFLMHHLLDNEEKIKQAQYVHDIQWMGPRACTMSMIGGSNAYIWFFRSNIFFELWSVPRNRRALVASLILMFFQVGSSALMQIWPRAKADCLPAILWRKCSRICE